MADLHLYRSIVKVRDFLLGLLGKEVLIFLCFLVLSGIFWLVMALNETYEKEVQVEVQLVNIPKNVVITEELPSLIKVTVRDKGYQIGSYLYGKVLKKLKIDFNTYSNGKGGGGMTNTELQRLLYQRLYGSSKIVSIKPDRLEFQYNLGRNKKVPVKLLGHIVPAKGYYLAKAAFEPDSVVVYAVKPLLDSISVVYITPQQVVNFRDTVRREVPLRKIAGAKVTPQTVRMTLTPDVLAEEEVEVPIEAVNMPEDKVLRTFPQKAKVRFVAGARILRNMPKNAETKQLLPRGFRVVADYQDIMSRQADKCRLFLRSTPMGIRSAQLVTDEADYLIEQR